LIYGLDVARVCHAVIAHCSGTEPARKQLGLCVTARGTRPRIILPLYKGRSGVLRYPSLYMWKYSSTELQLVTWRSFQLQVTTPRRYICILISFAVLSSQGSAVRTTRTFFGPLRTDCGLSSLFVLPSLVTSAYDPVGRGGGIVRDRPGDRWRKLYELNWGILDILRLPRSLGGCAA
jgi:hypothetical protein